MIRLIASSIIGCCWAFLTCFIAVAEAPQSKPTMTLGQLVVQSTPESDRAIDVASENQGKTENSDDDREAKERHVRRLRKLQRPLAEISLQEPVNDAERPDNFAKNTLKDDREIVIGGDSELRYVDTLERYTISSCHRPLYFEELNLERCGNTYGYATNAVSAFHFLVNTAALPYRIATQRPDCPIPSHGDCKTCERYSHDIEPFGFETKGLLLETAAIAGFVFLAM